MYVAVRELKVGTPKGLVIIKPGQEIPDFEKWNEVAKRANINMGFVKEVAGMSTGTPSPSVSAKVEVKAQSPGILGCNKCQKTGFKTPRALKTHVTLAHGK